MAYLFEELDHARYGDGRQKRTIFLPKYLKETAEDQRLKGSAFDHAHEILIKWADIEKSGKLSPEKETSLEAEFVTEVFGQALGYKLFAENEDSWELRQKFKVNGGEADVALGEFSSGKETTPRAIIELKGPKVNVDRDKFNGRTAVQQCWDYLNALPECPWGIVCNFVSFRLYHRDKTPSAYELFTLQELRKPEVFRKFYSLFQVGGLLRGTFTKRPRADMLLARTAERQQEVGQQLYQSYHANRLLLIRHLRAEPHNKQVGPAIRIAQKLLDRIIFVAFCEDRGLLPRESIRAAFENTPPFSRVTNPRWQNFLNLFRSIDEGNKQADIPAFNGGLFRQDPEVDTLQLDDEWTQFFKDVSDYDFRDEVNLDVLGHIFEQSINDLEDLRLGSLFEGDAPQEADSPKMTKSAERKRGGIYYTPPQFTDFITRNTIRPIIEAKCKVVAKELGLSQEQIGDNECSPQLEQYWQACFDAFRQIKVCDPACGSGAFLIQAYDILEQEYHEILAGLAKCNFKLADELKAQVPDIILQDNIYGVDLSLEAVEITQLALWIRSAQEGRTLADLSHNIVCGNSLVSDTAIDPRAMIWQEKFPEIFSGDGPGFDCVIGNPPWERLKLQEREFFNRTAPRIASAVNAATRKKLIASLEKDNPELHQSYLQAKDAASKTLDHVRKSGRFPLTGKGDINTYTVFAELASSIVAPSGRVGLLVPSGIATDNTTKDFFSKLVDEQSLALLYDFENKKGLFPDVHRAFKFSVIIFGGESIKTPEVDFVFFAHGMSELQEKRRHISLSAKDMALMNPNTHTCPIFRSRKDCELTKEIYNRVPILLDRSKKKTSNPWGISFATMFHQTNDAGLFRTGEQLKADKFKLTGNAWQKGKKQFLPLYEAKMIQAFDHRAASVVVKDENWFRQGQTEAPSLVQHQDADFVIQPRWWAEEHVICDSLRSSPPCLLAFKNVTSPTNRRTMIAALIPPYGVVNSAPFIQCGETINELRQCCLLANLNAFVLDYVARQKIGNVNLNFFLIEQFPMLPPDDYLDECPWSKGQTLEKWISDRVLKLTCTANDMLPLAEAAGFKPGVHKWKPRDRARLRAELDAAYFLLYGIQREDVEYILGTFKGTAKTPQGVIGHTQGELILEQYDALLASC